MTVEELVNLFLNSSVSIGCLVYFMWYNSTIQKENNKLLEELKEVINKMVEKIEEMGNIKEE